MTKCPLTASIHTINDESHDARLYGMADHTLATDCLICSSARVDGCGSVDDTVSACAVGRADAGNFGVAELCAIVVVVAIAGGITVVVDWGDIDVALFC